jgi:hypothetical protein
MRWIRGNARLNSWVALLALAVNFAVSFGHVHVPGSHASEHASIVEALASFDHSEAPGHSDDSHPDDLCPICVAAATLANALVSTLPTILVQFDEAIVDRTTTPVCLIAALHRGPFQSRGPPIPCFADASGAAPLRVAKLRPFSEGPARHVQQLKSRFG